MVRNACGGDEQLWEQVRKKVHGIMPDGAFDEQLAARLNSTILPQLWFVLRCSGHAAQGCIKTAWSLDETVVTITGAVLEVAKFLRSSPRFQSKFADRASFDEAISQVENFSFAPQRFASLANPFGRFALFGNTVMAVLAEEAERPTSPDRAKWAIEILRQLDGAAWNLIGALADLSEDCIVFVRMRFASVVAAAAVPWLRMATFGFALMCKIARFVGTPWVDVMTSAVRCFVILVSVCFRLQLGLVWLVLHRCAWLCLVELVCAWLFLFLPGCASLGPFVLGSDWLCSFLLDCAWLCQFVPDCVWLCPLLPGCAWLCPCVPVLAWLCLVVPICAWRCLDVPVCVSVCMFVLGCTCSCLALTECV